MGLRAALPSAMSAVETEIARSVQNFLCNAPYARAARPSRPVLSRLKGLLSRKRSARRRLRASMNSSESVVSPIASRASASCSSHTAFSRLLHLPCLKVCSGASLPWSKSACVERSWSPWTTRRCSRRACFTRLYCESLGRADPPAAVTGPDSPERMRPRLDADINAT